MNGINKEIDMNVELEFDGLRIPGPHGNGNILSKSGEKYFTRALIECLQFQKYVLESFPV